MGDGDFAFGGVTAFGVGTFTGDVTALIGDFGGDGIAFGGVFGLTTVTTLGGRLTTTTGFLPTLDCLVTMIVFDGGRVTGTAVGAVVTVTTVAFGEILSVIVTGIGSGR